MLQFFSMRPGSRTPTWGYRIALAILVLTNLFALGWIAQPLLERQGLHLPFYPASQVQPAASTPAPTATASLAPQTPTDTAVPISLQNGGSPTENLRAQGVLVMAIRDGSFSHLFAYHPLYLPLTRLTNTPWDDASPALSPDGKRLAYSSRQNGYWDLYALDLETGQKTRLTDTPEYEGSPTWSPDGLWIAYERYNGVSLDIYIQSLTDPSADPIQLTDDPGTDRSPSWSPGGREVAFVSSRTGDEEIWLARLDRIDDRFFNASNSPLTRDRYPVWSPDGARLAWAADESGDRRLAVWAIDHPEDGPKLLGEGELPAWSPDGNILFSKLSDPNQVGLTAYTASVGRLAVPYIPLPGEMYGMTWVKGPLPAWLDQVTSNPDTSPAEVLWQPTITRTVSPEGRAGLVTLEDVTAPQPMLLDAVDEAFVALRAQVAAETGWDVLSSLENAYLPLTSPALPTLQDDWLYTGRAFAINPLLLSAGWISIVREDFQGQTYWRVLLKARYQDGSMGMPMTEMVWDLNARYAGNTRAYEQGGKLGQVPTGYWVDLTEITRRYSWERLPAWINWRTFYPSIRFNQFVITGGLEWNQAMGDLYPPEALMTITPMPTYTATATKTPEFTPRPITVTPMPTLTQIPTRRPTWTPLPAQP